MYNPVLCNDSVECLIKPLGNQANCKAVMLSDTNKSFYCCGQLQFSKKGA